MLSCAVEFTLAYNGEVLVLLGIETANVVSRYNFFLLGFTQVS